MRPELTTLEILKKWYEYLRETLIIDNDSYLEEQLQIVDEEYQTLINSEVERQHLQDEKNGN